MIVITKDTETAFYNTLDRLNKHARDQRCLYIRFSKLDARADIWFTPLCEALETIADGHIGQLYLCEDNDVFVLMPHLTRKHVQKFLESFANLMSAGAQYPILELISLHELKVDYSILRSVCERKIEELNRKEQIHSRHEMHSLQNQKALSALRNLPPEIVMGVSHQRRNRRKVEILIAEDDALARMMIKNILVTDFTVHLAVDGKAAIESYFNHAPDILFLDIGLPDISGHTVLEQIIEVDPEAYIVMFSGFKDQNNILKALHAGATGYIAKPFTRGKLFQYIEQCPGIQLKEKLSRPRDAAIKT